MSKMDNHLSYKAVDKSTHERTNPFLMKQLHAMKDPSKYKRPDERSTQWSNQHFMMLLQDRENSLFNSVYNRKSRMAATMMAKSQQVDSKNAFSGNKKRNSTKKSARNKQKKGSTAEGQAISIETRPGGFE